MILKVQTVLKLIRVHQWIKNVFIFVPSFFGFKLLDTQNLSNLCLTFISFSFVASAVYILNDYQDIEKDRLHPQKKYRPLAAQLISIQIAFIIFFLFLSTGIILSILLNPFFTLIILVYFFMNVLYSYLLKKIAILDISIIAIGFLLRIFSGSIISDVIISKWLVLMTFLLSMFIALAKRRSDFIIVSETKKEIRKSLDGYNLEFINASMVFMASVTFVAYLMYAISSEINQRLHHDYTYLTSFIVIMGILRYFQLTFVKNYSGSPTKLLLKDKVLLGIVIVWVLSFFIILYL